MISISTGSLTVSIDQFQGGRINQITVGDTPFLLSRSDVPDADAFGWGCFPMVPWAGRIRRGRFVFADTEYQLDINHGAHAIHGLAYAQPWTVDAVTPTMVAMSLPFPDAGQWPFGGHATQKIQIADRNIDRSADNGAARGNTASVALTLAVTAHDQAFPVSFGWHPWFRKPSHIDFYPLAQYVRDADYMAIDKQIPPQPGPWDDAFVNTAPVLLHYPHHQLVVTADVSTWVVYDMPAQATCVEPQTAPPDAFTIAPTVLQPGETMTAHATITIRSIAIGAQPQTTPPVA